MSYVDIALLVIIGLFSLFGLIGGFGKTFSKIFGWIMTFLIVFIITDLVANAILSINKIADFVIGTDGKGFSLAKFVFNKIPDGLSHIAMDDVKAGYLEMGKSGITKLVRDEGGVIFSLIAPIIASIVVDPVYFASNVSSVGEVIAIQLGLIIFCIMLGIVLFFIVRIIMAIIARVIRKHQKEKKNALSRIGGLVVGGVRGGLYCVVLLLILNLIMSANVAPLKAIDKQFEESKFANKSMEIVLDVKDKIKETNKSNDNKKKAIKLLNYENGTSEEIKAWEELIKLVNSAPDEENNG